MKIFTSITYAGIWAITSFVSFPQMRFQNPMTEIINKTLDLMTSENFSLNSISIPPDFNMCTEDFISLGIRRDVFGSVYFLFSIAIPCKFIDRQINFILFPYGITRIPALDHFYIINVRFLYLYTCVLALSFQLFLYAMLFE